MPHNRIGCVDTTPARDTRAQPKLGIIPIREEIFIKTADFFKHFSAIESGAAIRPEHFLFAIVLPAVFETTAAAAVLPIGENQVPGLIEQTWIFPNQNLADGHADV